MKLSEQNMVEVDLKVKSTAALREEVIKELTQPDKSINLLLDSNDKDTPPNTVRIWPTDIWQS